MPFRFRRWALVLGLAAFELSAAGAHAQGRDVPTFPDAAAQWINSAPLSAEQLKGKAALLWYFEEDCPRCREKWPAMLELSRRYADEPIVFIAVNSGSARGEIETYAKQNRINWPIIVDSSREFEKASDVGEISLQNIHQMKLLMGDGTFRNGNWQDLEGSITAGLKGAEWRVDPKSVAAPLKGAWVDVELGRYASAASVLTKSLKAPKPEVKESAEKLVEFVKEQFDADLASAKSLEESGEKWKAYRAYSTLLDKFKGYEMAESVEKTRKQLSTDRVVKEELAAWKLYEQAAKQIASPAAATKKRANSILEKLVKDQPETEAGQKARELLSRAG